MINFRYFSKIYHRPFLLNWSRSWLGFFFVCLGLGYSTLPPDWRINIPFFNLAGSATYMTGAFIQSFFLIVGSYELIKDRQLSKRSIYMLFAITIILGTSLTLLYAFDDSRFVERYFIRIGLRSLITGIAFIYCGVIAFFSQRFGEVSFGRRLLGTALMLYGLELTGYFVVVYLIIIGYNLSIVLSIFGVTDLFLITIIGLGMVMWLLEDERLILKKTNNELDSFLYSTSHDLRAPIASILGLTNLAALETKDSTILQYFKMIETRVKKLDSIISDILTYSKNTKLQTQEEHVDFNALIEEILSDIKFDERAAGIQIIYEGVKANELSADRGQLKIILSNLLSNAIKYHDLSKDNPYIRVDFKKDGHAVEITISDNGQGIAQEHHDKIFDMFYRANSTSEGSGLGLFIVQEASRKIKGEVSLQSQLNEGSNFKLTFKEHL
ncbi:ATP-binding protein [Fulvivirga sp. M361]|uniref:sensor histidine kinase n=1 Tax=Fulvivirga sp. M361 TaxID=2594266 RepID=UPI001624CBCE|nr:HAMP domain-containing sensor histidine kinase [Fulvivirga sp. M361]